MKVRWTTHSVEQLESIFDFIAADNFEAALRTVQRIRSAIQRAAQFPRSGRRGRLANTREAPVSGTRYVVVYRVLEEDKAIHVMAILHGAQEWPTRF